VTTLSRLHCVGPGTHEERQISHFKCKSCIPAVVVPRFRACSVDVSGALVSIG